MSKTKKNILEEKGTWDIRISKKNLGVKDRYSYPPQDLDRLAANATDRLAGESSKNGRNGDWEGGKGGPE